MVKTFAVIGDPVDHSLSPNIHNAVFRELKLDCAYIAYRIPKGELKEGIDALKTINVIGFNVTIPHKIEMLKFLDEQDETCKIIGAANTVVNENDKLKGYNTDMDGFLDPIKNHNLEIKNSSVLLLGAGGAARAIVAGFVKEKAQNITIANRTIEKADALAKFAGNQGVKAKSCKLDDVDTTLEYKFIVNSTAIGLKNEPMPIPSSIINQDSIVYDIVYRPMNTDLIKQSKEKGATIIYGYEMLLGQAKKAFEIWHKREAPYDIMKKALLGRM